jgi:arylsulfatase A-like enzyme
MRKRTKPDVFLIVLDTVRADRLSCYGYRRGTTPQIDAFAQTGVLFERAISPAQWTIPAHASLFTGEYPTTHMTTQVFDKHSESQITLAQVLRREGYCAVGFCNNPYLGVVKNELDRGFHEMYNYSGAWPNRPIIADSRPRLLGRLAQRLGRLLRHLGSSIQDAFARNKLLVRIALHPRLAPLWGRVMNLKGNTPQSLRDAVGYLRIRQQKGAERPVFVFINLMETHLPYHPRKRFIRRFAPVLRQDRQARDFMQSYNLEHYRWMLPLKEPFTELQDRVINDMYDAELAYEDHLLRWLFSYLDEPEVRDNTLVIITSDHGEGLNHHDFVGHSLVVYNDLIRVPLIVRYPPLYPKSQRVSTLVSTRRVFHSALEAAGIYSVYDDSRGKEGVPVDVKGLSLARSLGNADPEKGIVFSEAYTPETLVNLMADDDPESIKTGRWRSMRRAVCRENYKLITVGDEPDELFDMIYDVGELDNLIGKEPMVAAELEGLLVDFRFEAESRRPDSWEAARLRLEEDEELTKHLRGLGYLG